jgi:hypothetical protein
MRIHLRAKIVNIPRLHCGIYQWVVTDVEMRSLFLLFYYTLIHYKLLETNKLMSLLFWKGCVFLPNARVLMGIESRSPGRPARSQTLYWLSYPAHHLMLTNVKKKLCGGGGIEHDPPAWNTNTPLTLQHKRTFHVPGAEIRVSCTATRSATLSCFPHSRTFYLKHECLTAFCHRTPSSYFCQGNFIQNLHSEFPSTL